MRFGPTWVAALIGLSIGLPMSGAARAEGAPRVAFVLRGTARDEGSTELLARVRGELRAARFEVHEVVLPGEAPPRETVEREARQPGVTAAMGIFLDEPEIEIWVANTRSTRAIIAAAAPPAAGTDSETRAMAAKAVDLLKAVLADVPQAEPAPPPTPPAPAAAPAVVQAAEASPPRDRILVAGVGWLRAGDAQTVAPLLGLSWIGRRLGIRATISGLGSSTELTAPAGTASIGQQVGLVELLGCLRLRARLLACGSAGGGVERLTVRGAGSTGFAGSDHALWSAVGALGAGVSWTPTAWIAFELEARALGAWPSTDIRIDAATVARGGGPGVWVTAGVGARL
ncbi:MAG TPA: hypothetical protein VMT03_27300 [Polyangia bacterium]|nr:hypothetical protein [Polyangia bacterium]